MSRFWGCSFMLALRETLSTYWIESESSRQDELKPAGKICPLFHAILHCADCSVRCESTPAPRATIAKTSTYCCCCYFKITTITSNNVADDVHNNYWTPYCFDKSQVKVVNFNLACSKILPPYSYFLEQCYRIQFTGIFHRGSSVLHLIACLSDAPSTFHSLWTRTGQRWSTFSASLTGLCCDSPAPC